MVRKFICGAVTLLLSFALFGANDIKIVTSGEGSSEREAIHNALRGALEDAYGTFLSSSTIIENDILVTDEISTLTKGNIKKYQIISSILNGNKYIVNVESIVSLDQFSNYCTSKGMKVEYDGAALNLALKMLQYNKENRRKMMNHLLLQLSQMTDYYDMYDYKLKIEEQKIHDSKVWITTNVSCKKNKNGKALYDFVYKNLNALKIKDDELQTYRQIGMSSADNELNVASSRIYSVLACMEYCFVITIGEQQYPMMRYLPTYRSDKEHLTIYHSTNDYQYNDDWYRGMNEDYYWGPAYGGVTIYPKGPFWWTASYGGTLKVKFPLSQLEKISSVAIEPMSSKMKNEISVKFLHLQIK